MQPSGIVSHHGRFAGIGIFDVGPLWSRMAGGDQPTGPAAALADDEHVIVTVDSDTGEIRECGDLSGRCVAMNSWTRAIASGQQAPVALQAHAAEVARQEREAVRDEEAAARK